MPLITAALLFSSRYGSAKDCLYGFDKNTNNCRPKPAKGASVRFVDKTQQPASGVALDPANVVLLARPPLPPPKPGLADWKASWKACSTLDTRDRIVGTTSANAIALRPGTQFFCLTRKGFAPLLARVDVVTAGVTPIEFKQLPLPRARFEPDPSCQYRAEGAIVYDAKEGEPAPRAPTTEGLSVIPGVPTQVVIEARGFNLVRLTLPPSAPDREEPPHRFCLEPAGQIVLRVARPLDRMRIVVRADDGTQVWSGITREETIRVVPGWYELRVVDGRVSIPLSGGGPQFSGTPELPPEDDGAPPLAFEVSGDPATPTVLSVNSAFPRGAAGLEREVVPPFGEFSFGDDCRNEQNTDSYPVGEACANAAFLEQQRGASGRDVERLLEKGCQLDDPRSCAALTPRGMDAAALDAFKQRVAQQCTAGSALACVKRHDLDERYWIYDDSQYPWRPSSPLDSFNRYRRRNEFFGMGLAFVGSPERGGAYMYRSGLGAQIFTDEEAWWGWVGLIAEVGATIQLLHAVPADGSVEDRQGLFGVGGAIGMGWSPPVFPYIRLDAMGTADLLFNRSATTLGGRGDFCVLLGPVDVCGSASIQRVPDIRAQDGELLTSLNGAWYPFFGGSLYWMGSKTLWPF